MIHTGEEVLCATCHNTSGRYEHLGLDLRDDAITWVAECRAAGAGLPTAVVKSFVPSESCLCRCYSHRFARLLQLLMKLLVLLVHPPEFPVRSHQYVAVDVRGK